MIVHKYYSNESKYTEDAIREAVHNRNYHFSHKSSLNDVFELYPRINPADKGFIQRSEAARLRICQDKQVYKAVQEQSGGNKIVRNLIESRLSTSFLVEGCDYEQEIEAQRNTWEQTLNHCGIFCTSTRSDSPVMWSLYANSHKGLCISYQILEDFVPFTDNPLAHPYFVEVSYDENPPLLVSLEVAEVEAQMQLQKWSPVQPANAKDRLVTTKLQEFNFENEIRALSRRFDQYVHLPYLRPTAITFGVRSSRDLYDQITSVDINLAFYKIEIQETGKLTSQRL